MAFSLLPTLLALFIAYPQLQMMHLDVPTALFNPVAIIRDVSWQETIGLLTGHLIYGGVLGALYTHPVGYPAAHPIKPKVTVRPFILAGRPPTPAPKRQRFLFATGIECKDRTRVG